MDRQYLKFGRTPARRGNNNSALPPPPPPPPPPPLLNYPDFTLFPAETDHLRLNPLRAIGQEDTSPATNLPYQGNSPYSELSGTFPEMSTMEYENDQRGYDGEFKHP